MELFFLKEIIIVYNDRNPQSLNIDISLKITTTIQPSLTNSSSLKIIFLFQKDFHHFVLTSWESLYSIRLVPVSVSELNVMELSP